MLAADRALSQDAFPLQRNDGDHEHDEEQRGVVRHQVGLAVAELAGAFERVDPSFAVIPGAAAIVNVGHVSLSS